MCLCLPLPLPRPRPLPRPLPTSLPLPTPLSLHLFPYPLQNKHRHQNTSKKDLHPPSNHLQQNPPTSPSSPNPLETTPHPLKFSHQIDSTTKNKQPLRPFHSIKSQYSIPVFQKRSDLVTETLRLSRGILLGLGLRGLWFRLRDGMRGGGEGDKNEKRREEGE